MWISLSFDVVKQTRLHSPRLRQVVSTACASTSRCGLSPPHSPHSTHIVLQVPLTQYPVASIHERRLAMRRRFAISAHDLWRSLMPKQHAACAAHRSRVTVSSLHLPNSSTSRIRGRLPRRPRGHLSSRRAAGPRSLATRADATIPRLQIRDRHVIRPGGIQEDQAHINI